MYIVITLSAHYDWEIHNGQPTQEDITALRFKPTQDGKWLKKVTKTKQTYTEINLPEAEIADCMAHFERTGMPKTRERVVAWFLGEKVMPHHAHEDHWIKISVHDEPKIEAFLNRTFDLNEKDSVSLSTPTDSENLTDPEKKSLMQKIFGGEK